MIREGFSYIVDDELQKGYLRPVVIIINKIIIITFNDDHSFVNLISHTYRVMCQLHYDHRLRLHNRWPGLVIVIRTSLASRHSRSKSVMFVGLEPTPIKSLSWLMSPSQPPSHIEIHLTLMVHHHHFNQDYYLNTFRADEYSLLCWGRVIASMEQSICIFPCRTDLSDYYGHRAAVASSFP